MKRGKPAPDHRCHGLPVFRDVCPGHVPVPIHNTDGSVWRTCDIPARLVECMEIVAKRNRCTFAAEFTRALADKITEERWKREEAP